MLLALVASLALASASTVAPTMQRATIPKLASQTLRLRGGIGDDELAAEASKIGKVAVTLTVTVHHIRSMHAPPTKVVIVGSLPELGNWDVKKGVTLVSTPETYPIFTGTLFLPPKTAFEYKYVVVKAEEGGEGVAQQWESVNSENSQRPMTTAAAGTMEIRNEFCESRGTDPRITDEPFQLTAQEWSRWYQHHMINQAPMGGGQEA